MMKGWNKGWNNSNMKGCKKQSIKQWEDDEIIKGFRIKKDVGNEHDRKM